MLAAHDIGDNVVMMVVFGGVFIAVPVCICVLALAGRINLQPFLKSGSKCPRCRATRTGKYCAQCGQPVDAPHKGGGS